MATAKLSDTQRLALTLATEGPLYRWFGGFWALASEPDRYRGSRSHKRGGPVPERYVEISTINALERRGFMEPVECDVEEWRQPRGITDAGRAALSKATPS